MIEEKLKTVNEIKDFKEAEKIIDTYLDLQIQLETPNRSGMIDALKKAQEIAPNEIQKREFLQGDTIPMLWVQFPDQDLYRKLAQYQQGLLDYAKNKIGEKAFHELMQQAREKGKSKFTDKP